MPNRGASLSKVRGVASIEVGKDLLDSLLAVGSAQEIPVSFRRDGKAIGHSNSLGRQLPSHFSQGGVLAANDGHVFDADFLKPADITMLCSVGRHHVCPLWPQFLKCLWEQMFDIFGLSLADMPRQNFENGAHHFFGIDRIIIAKDSRDVIQEFAFIPLLHRLSRKFPSLVINTPYEGGQLCSQMNRFLDGEPIPEGVQPSAQRETRVVGPVFPPELSPQIV